MNLVIDLPILFYFILLGFFITAHSVWDTQWQMYFILFYFIFYNSTFSVGYSRRCNNDYLEVREGDASGRLIGRYCGRSLPGNITASNGIWMKFRSDNRGTRRGFSATYNSGTVVWLSPTTTVGVITPNKFPLTTILTYLQKCYGSRISNHWATIPACTCN